MATFKMLGTPSYPLEDGPPALPDGEGGTFGPSNALLHISAFFVSNYITYPLMISPFTLTPGDLNIAYPQPGNHFNRGMN